MNNKKHQCNFKWDAERGTCRCTLTYKNEKYVGFAFTHPTDMDMKSEKVGQEIAYHRAVIAMLKGEKKKLKYELRGLNSLYYSMKHSPKFNSKGYESKMLYRQIQMRNDDIESINELIKEIETFIISYVNKKDALYEKIRANRKDNAE